MQIPDRHSPLTILLAIDGSENSFLATQLVRDLELAPGSQVMAMGVMNARMSPGRATLLAAQDKASEILEGSHAKFNPGILHGHPAEEISKFADKSRPHLVVVGARGLRATLGILLGGVSQQVVEYSTWPVLVVRPPYEGLRKVLIVTDGSPQSQLAVRYMAHFPLPVSSRLTLMNVLPATPHPSHAEDGAPSTQQMDEEEKSGRSVLDEARQTLQAGSVTAEVVLRRGDPATEILDYIRQNQVDLVVAGSRGLSTVRGWLLGSVSRKLVHYADSSVLIVREQPPEDL